MKKPKNLWQLKKKIAKLEKQLRDENQRFKNVTLDLQENNGTIGGTIAVKFPQSESLAKFAETGEIKHLSEKDVAKFIQNSTAVENEKDQN